MMKFTTSVCQNCGKEVRVIEGYTYFGIFCPECLSKDNAYSLKAEKKK